MEGFVGNYKVTVRRNPRYVNEEACIGCLECKQPVIEAIVAEMPVRAVEPKGRRQNPDPPRYHEPTMTTTTMTAAACALVSSAASR